MIPHITFSEMLGSAAFLLFTGMIIGATLYHKYFRK